MSEDQILSELRTIRTLLAIDKGDELENILSALDEIQNDAIDELDDSWNPLPTSEIAEEHGKSVRTVQRRLGELEELNLIERRGTGRSAEYRSTGLLEAAQLVFPDN